MYRPLAQRVYWASCLPRSGALDAATSVSSIRLPLVHAHERRVNRASRTLTMILTVCVVLAPSVLRAQTGVDMGCSPTVANDCRGTTSGSSASTLSPELQQAASLIGSALGDALHKALFGDPAEKARQAALLRQQMAVQAENARLREIADKRRREEMFARLMGSLKLSGVETLALKGFDGDAGGITLKGVDLKQSTDANSLHLKLGDATSTDASLHPAGTLAFDEHRTTTSPTNAPNTDAMVVDLRDMQQSAFLVQSAGTVSPNDAPLLLDEALGAANGDKSFIAKVPSSFVLPAIDASGLIAFQTANAEYRRANDSRMHLTEVFALAQQRREQADKLADAAIADLETVKSGIADETTLNRKHELMVGIFADVRARDEAAAQALANAELASVRTYEEKEEAIRVLRAVAGSQPIATFTPPIPSLVDIDAPLWSQVQAKVDEGWKELDLEADKVRAALAAMNRKVPEKYERMREGVILGAFTNNADVVAMESVRDPFTNKTPREMNEEAATTTKAGIKELGGAVVVSFGTTNTGTASGVVTEVARVAGDHFSVGLASLSTVEGKAAVEKLSGKAFDRLNAHSNGSPIAEALIESNLIKVNELNIIGGDRSLLNGHRLQKLLDEGKVKRVVVWVNVNDPVVWASSIDQLKPQERSANALEHIARKLTGDLAGGDSRVQFRYMVGNEPWKGDVFAQHGIGTAYYHNISNYFQSRH